MKKRLLAILLAGITALSLSACGSNKANSETANSADKSSEKPKKISIISTTDDVPLFEYVAKKYKEKYGVDVEIISQAYDNTHQKITTSFSGNTDIDLTYVDVPWAAEFGSLGVTIPVDNYMPEEFKSGIIKGTLDQMIYDGKTQAIPFANNGKWMFYNKEILEKGGYKEPPKTWDELKAMSKDLMAKGLAEYGIAWAGKQSEGLMCDVTTMLYAFGGQWQDKDGKFVFDSEAGIKGLSVIADSIKEGWADPASSTYGDRENLDPFMAGDVPFVMNWSFAWGLTNSEADSKVAGKVGICLIPGSDKAVSASVTGGGGLAIMATSKHPDYAWKFIEMLVSDETQKYALEKNSTLPTIASIYQDENMKSKFDYLGLMYPQYEYSHSRPKVVEYSEWSNTVQPIISGAVFGEISVEEAMKKAMEVSVPFEK